MIITLSDIPDLAQKILTTLQPGDVLALSGKLASGKTTLTQAVLKAMGYNSRVTSPTFVLEKHYPVNYDGFKEVTHLDFYRLSPEQLTTFGWKDYLGTPGSLTIIEWPEIGLDHLPNTVKTIKIEIVDDERRKLTFSNNFNF